MSTTFDEEYYNELKENFAAIFKRIQPYERKRKLTKNLELRNEYKNDIVVAFNDIIIYIRQFHDRATETGRNTLRDAAFIYIAKVKRAFRALKLKYNWPELDYFHTVVSRNIVVRRNKTDRSLGV